MSISAVPKTTLPPRWCELRVRASKPSATRQVGQLHQRSCPISVPHFPTLIRNCLQPFVTDVRECVCVSARLDSTTFDLHSPLRVPDQMVRSAALVWLS